MEDGGSWSAYWYNGVIVSSEISRGLDIFELTPSGFISQNDIAAARLGQPEEVNTQDQPTFGWPARFTVPRAYSDQRATSDGMAAQRLGTRASGHPRPQH